MPTGYTADIGDGITFEEFALSCARAFGALVTMREEPHRAPIPEEFKPMEYHRDNIMRLEAELQGLDLLSQEEIAILAEAEYDNEINRINKHRQEREELEEKYLDMLSQVKRWKPPTEDHINLKKFMIEQIVDSIKFDCEGFDFGCPVKQSPSTWLFNKKASINKSIRYHLSEDKKERDRVNDRNIWLRKLRQSLK